MTFSGAAEISGYNLLGEKGSQGVEISDHNNKKESKRGKTQKNSD